MKKEVQDVKPDKKNDKELWSLISEKILNGDFLFLEHAKKRLTDRNVIDLDVLDILENKENRKRKRNKKKDTYISGCQDWNYCIEGYGLDNKTIRIIISFNKDLMLIITVIRLDSLE